MVIPLPDVVLMEPIVQSGKDGLPQEKSFSMERSLGLPLYDETCYPEGAGFQFRSGPVVVGQTVTVSPPHTLGIQSLFSAVDLVGFKCCCPRDCCLEDILDIQLNLEGILVEGRITSPRLFRLKEYVRERLRNGDWDEGEVRAEHLNIPPFLRILNPRHRIATIPRRRRASRRRGGGQRAFEVEVLVARGSGRFERDVVGSQMPPGFMPLEARFQNVKSSNNARVFNTSERLYSGAPIIQEWMFTRIYLRRGFVLPKRAKEEVELEGSSLWKPHLVTLRKGGIRTIGELLQCSSSDVLAIRGAGLAAVKGVASWLSTEHSSAMYDPNLFREETAVNVYLAGLERARNTFDFLRRELVEKGPTRLDDPRFHNDSAHKKSKAPPRLAWLLRVLFSASGERDPRIGKPSNGNLLGIKGVGPSTLRWFHGKRVAARA